MGLYIPNSNPDTNTNPKPGSLHYNRFHQVFFSEFQSRNIEEGKYSKMRAHQTCHQYIFGLLHLTPCYSPEIMFWAETLTSSNEEGPLTCNSDEWPLNYEERPLNFDEGCQLEVSVHVIHSTISQSIKCLTALTNRLKGFCFCSCCLSSARAKVFDVHTVVTVLILISVFFIIWGTEKVINMITHWPFLQYFWLQMSGGEWKSW